MNEREMFVDDILRSRDALYKEAEGRSLQSLLAQHGRERLFVRPILWDHRQPALLQCRFLPPMPPAPPLPAAPRLPEKYWKPSPKMEYYLTEGYWDNKDWERWERFNVARLLRCRYYFDAFDATYRASVKLEFGGRPVSDIVIEDINFAEVIAPGIIDLKDKCRIEFYRAQAVGRFAPGARQSPQKHRILYERHVPAWRLPDPYVAAVLIALAQAERKQQETSEEEKQEELEKGKPEEKGHGDAKEMAEKSYPVRVILHRGGWVSVFAADVTAAFLAKLDAPGKPPRPGASMDIHEQEVEFHPWKTFAARLAGAVQDTRHLHRPANKDAGESGQSPAEHGEAAVAPTSQPCEADRKRKQRKPAAADRKALRAAKERKASLRGGGRKEEESQTRPGKKKRGR